MIGQPEGPSAEFILEEARISGDTFVLNMKENVEQGKVWFMFKRLYDNFDGQFHYGMKVSASFRVHKNRIVK
jgi:hypothetical protein